MKGLPETNNLAYYKNPYITAIESILKLAPAANVIKPLLL
jgi:hypothetical protein